LVGQNKAVAAQLDPFPFVGTEIIATKGHKNSKNRRMCKANIPLQVQKGKKPITDFLNLVQTSTKRGGVLTDSEHIEKIVESINTKINL
jgi:hypothetical protein